MYAVHALGQSVKFCRLFGGEGRSLEVAKLGGRQKLTLVFLGGLHLGEGDVERFAVLYVEFCLGHDVADDFAGL